MTEEERNKAVTNSIVKITKGRRVLSEAEAVTAAEELKSWLLKWDAFPKEHSWTGRITFDVGDNCEFHVFDDQGVRASLRIGRL